MMGHEVVRRLRIGMQHSEVEDLAADGAEVLDGNPILELLVHTGSEHVG